MPGRLYTPIILRQPLRITTVALSNASAGTAYTATLAGSGGIPPYTWKLLSTWPGSWLSLNANTGVLSGTPPNPEIDVLAIQLTDSTGMQTTAVLMLSTPTTVSASVISSSEIDLTWVPITGVTSYILRRNGTTIYSGSSPSFNNTGLTASTTYSYTVSGVGIYGEGAQSAAINATTQSSSPSSFSPDFPRTSWHGTGGTISDLYWNNPTVTVQRLGSIPILTAYGKYGVFTVGSDFEGFAHDLQGTITTAKAASTTHLGTRFGKYGMAEETYLPTDTTNYPGYKTWADVVMSPAYVSTGSNFLAYTSHTTGTPVNAPDGSPRSLVNIAENISGTPYAGFTINIGQTWTCAQWTAYYQYYKDLNKTRTGAIPSLFTNCNVLGAAPALDFIDMDNIFVYWGVQADIFRNGTLSPAANELTYSGAYSDALAFGQARMFNQLKTLIASSGGTQWTSGNSGAYARIDLGNTQTTAGAMWQVQNSGFWETVIGKPNALEWQLTFPTLLACYQHYLDFLAPPKVLRINLVIPNGGLANTPPYNATPTAVNGEYQHARYLASFAALNDGFGGIQLQTSQYNLNGADLRWYDEFDNAGAQMNWMGQAVDPGQTSVYVWADGSTIPNVYARRYANGIAICVAPTGTGSSAQPSGTVTITGAQLGISTQPLKRIAGTQAPAVNSGAVITSAGVTLQASRDGIFLVYTSAAGVMISGSTATITGTGFGTKPGTAAPLFYNSFNNSPVGSTPSAVGLTNSIDATVVNIQNDRAYIGTQALKGVFPANTESFPEISFIPPANTSEIYVSGAFYWTTSAPASASQFIWKLTRMGCGTLYHGVPQQYCTTRPDNTGTVTGGDWGYNDGGGTVAWCSSMYYSTNPLPGPHSDQWNFLEFAHKFSNPSGGATGYSEMRCNSQNLLPSFGAHSQFVNQTTGANLTSGNTNNSGTTANYTWVITFFDGLSVPGNTNTQAWLGFLYIDNCRNRVVVSDNVVLANSTKTKILMLICSTWGNTQVVGTNSALTTMYPSGSTAVFHVFDGTGTEVATFSKVMP